MKKTILPLLLALLMLLPLLAACGTVEKDSANLLTVRCADLAPARFAEQELLAAAEKVPLTEAWTVSLETIDETLGAEGYRIAVDGNTVTVSGGDATGLMYGGLALAEQIAFGNGFSAVQNAEGAPAIQNRGVKFNLPLDMRTPSYTDAGDAAQLNIADMWDMDFWKAELDELARNRFNVLSLWNLNPFPSMVKLEDYPDVALDDVWRTTLPFDGTYNGTATDLVRPEHWENYEVVKTMTIDEKIAFWQDVMAYAHDRGIKVYLFTWNIYTYGENGKYGITSDAENEITRDYFRKSVEALVETYPDLDGLGFSAGENMDWSNDQNSNEEWLWNVYGLGINAALEKEPDRDFTLIHRRHLVYDFEELNKTWGQFRGTLDFSDKYSFAHMHSTTTPHFADDTVNSLPADRRTWLELRNDDMYYARWGDADFIRDYIQNMPDSSKLRGFFFGADGYILGRDYTSRDSDEYGMLHIRKHWYEYALLGRLGYDPGLSDEFFRQLLAEHFEGVVGKDKTDLLFDAMQAAGKIIPQVTRFFWIDTDAYYPEMCLTHRTAFQFLNVKNWATFRNALEGAGVLSVPDTVAALQEGQTEFEQQTPDDVAKALYAYAEEATKNVDLLLADEPQTYSNQTEKEFYSMVKDQKMQALMGFYYAEKTAAALDLGLYNASAESSYQESAITHLKSALEYWKAYAAEFDARYLPMMMSRLQLTPSPNDLLADVEKDISIAERWRIR